MSASTCMLGTYEKYRLLFECFSPLEFTYSIAPRLYSISVRHSMCLFIITAFCSCCCCWFISGSCDEIDFPVEDEGEICHETAVMQTRNNTNNDVMLRRNHGGLLTYLICCRCFCCFFPHSNWNQVCLWNQQSQ